MPLVRAQSLFFVLGAPVLPGVNFWAHGQNFRRTGKNFRSTIRILGVLKGKVREAWDILEVTINRYVFSTAIMCLFLSISRLVFSISRMWMADIRQLKLILLAIFDKIFGRCSATWQLVVSGWIAPILALPCWCGLGPLLWTRGGCFSLWLDLLCECVFQIKE